MTGVVAGVDPCSPEHLLALSQLTLSGALGGRHVSSPCLEMGKLSPREWHELKVLMVVFFIGNGD